ncbi:hypothetical protein C7G43_16570 [Bradyrhizobium sp. MOS004]|uniref:Secreted protein n=1 Tax=Bradyrhizobium guangdongense TaxID=1325090 RepID=A0ABX6UAN8_9BRAD|nr:hypothetical protein C7G43_16570 [Bradyrhizobium sp. MOS004]QAU37277.1 hypothetical protein X265_05995 [Bradyrhizobium guangdongense]QOZ58333.1 hypothetical protein XH86_05995 [Bradyrhizobium guangdongense]
MRRQLDDETIRQRFGRVLIILLGISSAACDRDDRALDGRAHFKTFGRRRIGALPDIRISCRHLVLRPDVTPVHGEASFGVDADEDTSSGDLRRFVKHRPVFECSQGRLDFAETLIDLVGQLVGIPVVDFQLGLLGVQRIDGGLLLRREIDGLAFDLS